MSLPQAIIIAQEAVRLDQMGAYRSALPLYIDACTELLKVIKLTTDASKKAGLKLRMDAYMKRAEQLKKLKDHGKLPVYRQPRVNASSAASAPRIPVASGAGASVARNAGSYFRPDSKFRADVTRAKQLRSQTEAQCKASGKAWTDPNFKPGVNALVGQWRNKPDAIKINRKVRKWMRPTQSGFGGYGSQHKAWSVFNGPPCPSDIDQGELGDCWFLSAISVLAGYPELIKRLLITTSFSEQGVYAVRLCYGGQWRVLMLDDWLPCSETGRPVFAAPAADGALWVALLEKAFAKLHGSFAAIVSGTAAEALAVLTGLPTKEIKDIHRREPKRKGDKTFTDDQLFAAIAGWHGQGYILCASCGHTDVPESEFDRMGLNHAHAYAILNIKAVGHGSSNQLIQLRNPWGSHEWKGAWSDTSSKWTTASRRRCGHDGKNKNDGIFWMSIRDFRRYFNKVACCILRRMFHQMRWPVTLPANLNAPWLAYEIIPQQRTRVDLCMIQPTERGRFPEGAYVCADMILLVVEIPVSAPGKGSRVPGSVLRKSGQLVASGSDLRDLGAVVTVEMYMEAGRRYLVIPWAMNTRALGREHICSVVIYSSTLLRPTKVGLGPSGVAAALRLFLKAHGKEEGRDDDAGPVGTPLPKNFNSSMAWGLSGTYLVENHKEPSNGFQSMRYLTFSMKLKRGSGLVSTRHGRSLADPIQGEVETVDVIPPRSWQIVTWWAASKGSWSYSSSWSSTYGGEQTEKHKPPLRVTVNGIHSCYPLDE
eukprot:g681.t1